MTWQVLNTRRGQLMEMAATLASAKHQLQAVLDDYPEAEAAGRHWLDRAVTNVDLCELSIEQAAKGHHS